MNPAQYRKADELESADLDTLTRESFRYPVEPVNSEAIWGQTFKEGALASFHRWNNALQVLCWLAVGLFIAGLILRFGGQDSGQLRQIRLYIWLWNIISTIMIFRILVRLKISIFDAFVWEAFTQARNCPTPWLMMRWLGEAFHYVQYSPCFFKVFYIGQVNWGIKSPNSFDNMRHQLRVAAVHALRNFEPMTFVGDKRPYDAALDGVLNKVPRLKYRWVVAADAMGDVVFILCFIELWLFWN